jgi:hypothetical protein
LKAQPRKANRMKKRNVNKKEKELENSKMKKCGFQFYNEISKEI